MTVIKTQYHLKELEDEGIFIMREGAAQFERPTLLFSGGKDSICMFHLALKAFYPGKIPFPLMHIDTGHNFPETIEFRDKLVEKHGVELIVGSVQESIDSGRVKEETGPDASRNALQTVTLLDTLKEYQIDAAIGGGRSDDEKARAKERFFSHRDVFGEWNPKHQRPEQSNLFNGRKNPGESFRVFPLSNWTEMDVWQYIAQENIEIPEIYFSHERRVFDRRGIWLRSEEHTSELQSRGHLVCRLLLEKKKTHRVRGKDTSAPRTRPSAAICRRRCGPWATVPSRSRA